jgi:membrane protease YdiL (CAAX protease family)
VRDAQSKLAATEAQKQSLISQPITWFATLQSLLQLAMQRHKGRVKSNLMRAKTKRQSSAKTLNILGFFFACLVAISGSYVFSIMLPQAQNIRANQQNKYLASADSIAELRELDGAPVSMQTDEEREWVFEKIVRDSNFRISREELYLRTEIMSEHFRRFGSDGFVARKSVFQSHASMQLLSAIFLLWWLTLVLQSEGMELDTTRRRHPMWEYFLSLPIPQSAVFCAEALTPLATNPGYWAAPFMIAGIVGFSTDSLLLGLCALPLALPMIVAAAIWAKCNEVGIMLRVTPRNRGSCFVMLAALGLVLWLAPMLSVQVPKLPERLIAWSYPVVEHLPSARWLFETDTLWHWLRALLTHSALAVLVGAIGIMLMRWAAASGLEAGFGGPEKVQTRSAFMHSEINAKRWWHDPLFRKELLWLSRDRSALIQMLLIPLLLVGSQALNFGNMMRSLELNWHRCAGMVIVLGGYMLFVTGPRALISEIPALSWMLSWPRALEDTLRMKVRVLLAIVSVIVLAGLVALMFVFPSDAWKILLLALLWPVYALSVAEKAVTLIPAPSSSGVPEPIPRATVWAAGLGNFAFGTGVVLGNWQVALLGISLNWVLAGALWQSFRARLPYLLDPQAQPEVRPPTILSAVLAILGMQELGIFLSIPVLVVMHGENAMLATTIGYAVAAATVCFAVWRYHLGQGVLLSDIVFMRASTQSHRASATLSTLTGHVLALLLAFSFAGLAHFYQQFLHSELLRALWPSAAETIAASDKSLRESPTILLAYAVLAVFVAPWAEEFLFRGLMFRAMRSQWRFWPALLASTTFFMVLHPMLSWPLVFMLGATNAWLFTRTKSLLPCVLLHFVYNGIVVLEVATFM